MATRNWFFKLNDEITDPDERGPTGSPGATEPTLLFDAAAYTKLPQTAAEQPNGSETPKSHPGSAGHLPEQLAVTRECSLPEFQPAVPKRSHASSADLPPVGDRVRARPVTPLQSAPPSASAFGRPAAEPDKNPADTSSVTMHAYVPPGAQLGPLTPTTRSALKSAQSQLKGSVPMLLADGAVSKAAAAKQAAPTKKNAVEGSPQKAQPVLLVAVAALVLAATVWNFYPGSSRVGSGGRNGSRGGLQATAASTQSPSRDSSREETVPCLTDSTQYRSSADRDELLRNVVGEFSQGRLERAHALLKEYQQVGCDRATLEAIAILERQLTQKSREH